MRTEPLYNKIDKRVLKERLAAEPFARIGASFYRYTAIAEPKSFRDQLYRLWCPMQVFGRIYVAHEGVNAQVSVPEHRWQNFVDSIKTNETLGRCFINRALDRGDSAFIKLIIKVRPQIVTDGLPKPILPNQEDDSHLSPSEFHERCGQSDSLVVDVRNQYEQETGHFEDAYRAKAETFKELLPKLASELRDHKDKELLLYCTGGIRCEKTSVYLRDQGYQNVRQLKGGVINYVNQLKKSKRQSKFKGSLFVFDNRLAESVDGRAIAQCYQCTQPYHRHRDCANQECHRLFIQCPECTDNYDGCCCDDCYQTLQNKNKVSA